MYNKNVSKNQPPFAPMAVPSLSFSRKNSMAYILGKAILFSSFQFAIGSVEMSSKFSVKNFSTDQTTLDNGIIALRDYIIIGLFWTLGTSLIFFANYGMKGMLLNVMCNILIIGWIYYSYQKAFDIAAKNHNLTNTPMWSATENKI
jgi:hypothetical protein